MNQLLVLKEGECKFNLPLKLRKSFTITQDIGLDTESPDYASMPDQFKSLGLGQGKYFWGYANVEQVDIQGDLFPIATLEELAPGLTKSPYNKVFLFHNYEDIAIGTILATATDSRGLLILAKLNEDHSRADEVWNSILNGSLDGFSMGGSFIEVESYYDEELEMNITIAKKAIATEVSLTSIPVNGGSLLQGAFQKARKIIKEKDPQFFMKGKNFEDSLEKVDTEAHNSTKKEEIKKDAENPESDEKFKYNKSQEKCMGDVSKLTKEQKEIFDKMVADGKSEDDAYKEVMAQQKQEASESVNQDLTGNDSKKKMKKSVDGEDSGEEEGAEEEAEAGTEGENETESTLGGDEETEEQEDGSADSEEKEDEEETKSEDEQEDMEEEAEEPIEEKYAKAMSENEGLKKENAELREKVAGFEKAVKPTEDKPMRKSQKTPQEQTPNPSNSATKSDTMVGWLKKN